MTLVFSHENAMALVFSHENAKIDWIWVLFRGRRLSLCKKSEDKNWPSSGGVKIKDYR